jgi:ribosomal protein L7/L12
MESLFILVAGLVVGVKALNDDAGESLAYVLSKMKTEWYDMKDELNQLRDVSLEKSDYIYKLEEKLSKRDREVEDLEWRLRRAEEKNVEYAKMLDDQTNLWRISIPFTVAYENKITAIKAVRYLTSWGLKESKEFVEKQRDLGLPLFARLCTSVEMENILYLYGRHPAVYCEMVKGINL